MKCEIKAVGIHDLLRSSNPCFYKTLTKLTSNSGANVRFKILGKEMIAVRNAQTIRELLLKNQNRLGKGDTLSEMTAMTRGLRTITERDGEDWAHLRNHFQPHFAKELASATISAATETANEAAVILRKNGRFNLYDMTSRLAFESICRAFFGYRAGALDDLASPFFYLHNQAYLVDQLSIRMKRGPFWKYLPIPSNFAVKKRARGNQQFLLNIIETRQKGAIPFFDSIFELKQPNGEAISNDQIMVHMYGMLGAAYESTGAIIHWALVLLALNPELQARVRDDDANLSFTKNVILETMRLYPAFPMIIRECIEPIEEPYRIKKGTVIFHMAGLAHRDPATWGADADEFRPERFIALTPEQRGSYFPYGLGRRICLGEPVAKGELPILLSVLVRQLQFQTESKLPPDSLLRFALGPRLPTFATVRAWQPTSNVFNQDVEAEANSSLILNS